ncbi:hypothetical protein AVEN_202495-1 [Araneus ventricosus]|uniref:Uncharacterized protein n=1 Tax=Araneus ventricosus TaxID=182803 RepID=A0A4Y2U2D5_ARAVE|nr:hypothetical protein AVEN_202495-1 [Araneus ventricosus]
MDLSHSISEDLKYYLPLIVNEVPLVTPIPDSKEDCGKVAISLSICCPRKHFRANRFGNHCRKIYIGKLFMNYLTDKDFEGELAHIRARRGGTRQTPRSQPGGEPLSPAEHSAYQFEELQRSATGGARRCAGEWEWTSAATFVQVAK